MSFGESAVKPLPHNEDIEKRILGTIILDNSIIWQVLDQISTEDFYSVSNKRIYGAFVELVELEQAINPVTVSEILRREGLNSSVKDLSEIVHELSRGLPKTGDISFYVQTLLDLSFTRKKIKLNERISRALLDGDDFSAMEAEAELAEISARKNQEGLVGVSSFSQDVLASAYEHGKNPSDVTGAKTGFKKFDFYTAGLQKSDLVILAARPSVGKTAFCLNIAQFAAVNEKKSVAVFSLEMSKEQLLMRLMSGLSRVPMQKLRTGTLDKKEWNRLIWAKKQLDSSNLYIDDAAGKSPMQVKAAAKKLQRAVGLDLLIIDYLQLMSPNHRAENRQQETSQISRELKKLAKELHIPILVLSQLNRAPEARTGKRPQLSDLRDSGAIEQDADIVCFLFREEMHQKTDENDGQAELIIAKQRNGATGTIPLFYVREFTRFENIFEKV